jgi:hypothetical protein
MLLGTVTSVHGQRLTWSEPLPWKGDEYHTRFIKSLSHGYLLVAQDPYSRQRYTVAHFNTNLNLQHEQSFEAPENSRLRRTIIQQDQVRFFFDQKANDSSRLISQRYAPKADSLYPGQKVTRFPGENTTIYLSAATDSTVNVAAVNSKARELTYLQLNQQLGIRSSYRHKLSEERNLSSIKSAIAKGSAMALIGKKTNSEEVLYYSLDTSSPSIRACSLSNDSVSVTTARLGYDRVNEQFLATGLYQKSDGNTYHGLAQLKGNQTGSEITVSYQGFSQDLVRRVFGQNTMKRGLKHFQLRGLIPRSDGGTIVFLESYQNDQKVYHDRGYFGTVNKTKREYHYYEEVVVMAVNPEGRTQWSEVHRKKQTTVNDEGRFSSFSHMIQKRRLIFLYNSIKSDAMNLLYYTVTPGGELKGELLLKDRYEQLKPIPRKATQTGPSTVLMPSLKEERLHMLRVNFNP